MGQLVRDDHGDPELVRGRALLGVEEEGRLPVGGQTPVLHGSGLEVRDGRQVCRRKRETLGPSVLTQ